MENAEEAVVLGGLYDTTPVPTILLVEVAVPPRTFGAARARLRSGERMELWELWAPFSPFWGSAARDQGVALLNDAIRSWHNKTMHPSA